MEHLTLEQYLSNPKLRAELARAARRERAKYLQRFMKQSAAALLGDGEGAPRAKSPCPEPCA